MLAGQAPRSYIFPSVISHQRALVVLFVEEGIVWIFLVHSHGRTAYETTVGKMSLL